MDLSRLANLHNRYTADKAGIIERLPGLTLLRRDRPSDIEATVYEPVICLILQGSKTTAIGDQSVVLKPGDALLVSHDLPVVSRITQASPGKPYLALILRLDLGLLRGLYELVAEAPVPPTPARSLSAGPVDPAWLTPLVRYIELAEHPLDARVLGPATLREIHYRLLLSPLGAMLRDLLVADSHASLVTRAILRMRNDYRSPLRVPDLARTAGMSASSFHKHFKTMTGTTPLQYQKDLRLIAARTLLADQSHSVSQAAFAVGYESPTHFSRDYSRKFGRPPMRDINAPARFLA